MLFIGEAELPANAIISQAVPCHLANRGEVTLKNSAASLIVQGLSFIMSSHFKSFNVHIGYYNTYFANVNTFNENNYPGNL